MRKHTAADRGRLTTHNGLSATQVLVIGFFVMIVVGTLLLHCPFAAQDGKMTPIFDCLFTAVSATCVTGLVVVDTALHWSGFGQAVILVMIQIGGLGFMTVALMLATLVKRHISPRERILLANSYNLNSLEGMLPLLRRVVCGTALFEGVGAAVLAIRFIPLFGIGDGIWRSVFHSVSAFCNAGFDLMGSLSGPFSSMTYFVSDPLVMLTLAALIMIGGIGFIVWDDVYEWLRARNPITVYTKTVVTVSAVLWTVGMLVVAVPEWNNPLTLGPLGTGEKLLASFFQSVTFRTAGFNTISLSDMSAFSQTASLLLMFIGGASGSTAGGVKVVTFGILVLAVWQYARGRQYCTVFGRTVPQGDVIRAFLVIIVQFFVTVTGAMILIGCGYPLLSSLFETFSAGATVGLSLGLTPQLTTLCRITLTALMYFGRVGILTVATAFRERSVDDENRLMRAEVRFLIG